jgi:hypothetical protein
MQLKFISTKEKLPKNGEYIFAIKTNRQLMYKDAGEPAFIKCEWAWNDGDGGSCGCKKSESSIENMPEGYKYLDIMDGEGYVIWTSETNVGNPKTEHFWWMTQKEFDNIWKKTKH